MDRKWVPKRGAVPMPHLTKACKRRLPASARTSLPLPAAPDARRWAPDTAADYPYEHDAFSGVCFLT